MPNLGDNDRTAHTLGSLIGALITHLIVVAAEKRWSPGKLDEEMVSGVRTVCRRYRINTLTSRLERRGDYVKREKGKRAQRWEERRCVQHIRNEYGSDRAIVTGIPMLVIDDPQMPTKASGVRINGQWYRPVEEPVASGLESKWKDLDR